MHRKSSIQQLMDYQVSRYMFPEEQQTVQQFINFVQTQPHCFERSNVGHITGSVWIVNKDFSKVLLTHHRKLKLWLQLGGHADGDTDIAAVALKEAQEESGIAEFTFLLPDIFDIDIHPIPNACAYHYDVRFLLQAQSEDFIISNESLNLAWVALENLFEYSSQRSIQRMYEKFEHYLRGISNPTKKLVTSHITSAGTRE